MVGRDTSIYGSYSGTFSLFSLSGFCVFFLSPLSWTSGGAGSSHEVSFANTWTIAVLNGFSRYPPPRRHWSKVAPQHTGDVSSLSGRMSPPLLLASLSRVLPVLLQDRERTSLKRKVRVSLAVTQLKKLDGGRAIWIVLESSALVRLKKLDGGCPIWTVRESPALVRLRSMDPDLAIWTRSGTLRTILSSLLLVYWVRGLVQTWYVGVRRRGGTRGCALPEDHKRPWPLSRGEMAMLAPVLLGQQDRTSFRATGQVLTPSVLVVCLVPLFVSL